MNRPPLEVADIVRCAGQSFIECSRKWINGQHEKMLLAITRCRTAALGGHRDQCSDCGHSAISYNSCRNRHCPKCRLVALANGKVVFRWRDSAHGNKKRIMTLAVDEFLRRFLLHLLPRPASCASATSASSPTGNALCSCRSASAYSKTHQQKSQLQPHPP